MGLNRCRNLYKTESRHIYQYKNTKVCICLCMLTYATLCLYALCCILYSQCSQSCFIFSHCFKCVLKTLSSVSVLISDGKAFLNFMPLTENDV